MNSHQLRRTKEKLATLQHIPHVKAVMSDMLHLIDEFYGRQNLNLFIEGEVVGMFLYKLEEQYKTYILENTPKDNTQLKAFEE